MNTFSQRVGRIIRAIQGKGRRTRRRILFFSEGFVFLAAVITLLAVLNLDAITLSLFLVVAPPLVIFGVILYLLVVMADFLRRHGVAPSHFAQGEEVFHQGDPGDFVYTIVKGEAQVIREDPDQEKTLLARLGPGDYFGEMALVNDAPRNATVQAATALDAVTLAREDFTTLYTHLPGLHQIVGRVMEIRRLMDPAPLDLAGLQAMWRGRTPERWAGTPEIYRLLGERVLRVGEPLLAHDVLSEGLEHWPRDVRLQQLLALTLARSGATYRANDLLHQLHIEGHADEETLGILARTHKDLWTIATTPAEKERHRRLAFDFYYEAYRATKGYYSGINAATLALLQEDVVSARRLAREVRVLCQEELERLVGSGGDAYWAEATLGEAALILGEWPEAEGWYSKAAKRSRGRFGDLSTTRRQARLLLEHLSQDAHRIDHCFGIPRVVVFTGQTTDQAGQAASPYSPSLEGRIRQDIRARLEELDAGIGYASAACVSGVLFLEAMLEKGGEINVILPYPVADFRKASVDAMGAAWGERFDKVLAKAANVYPVSEYGVLDRAVPFNTASLFVDLVMDGIAVLRGRMLDTELTAMVVWDGRTGDEPGEMCSLVQHWQSRGRSVEKVEITKLLSESDIEPVPVEAMLQPESFRQVRAVLFAQAVGYSMLTEEQRRLFSRHFSDPIDKIAARFEGRWLSSKPTGASGWFMVFSSVAVAGAVALDLRGEFRRVDWAKVGLPGGIQITLDAVAASGDPHADAVAQRLESDDRHVSRVAWIEPITPWGQVYASQSFAALAAAQGVTEFTCDYVGQVPLAKSYDTIPMYHIDRRR